MFVLVAVVFAVREEPALGETPASEFAGGDLPSVQKMIEARTDVWGDAARQEPNGASYEFFKDLLPPLRWVNTDFRHYPLVLSAPRSLHKTRLVSNGSAINARANKPPMWYEQGVPVTFLVGESREVFGEDVARLDGPTYVDGYLPIVSVKYRQDGAIYQEEVFAPVDEYSAGQGTAMIRFSLAGAGSDGSATGNGRIVARARSDSPLRADRGDVLNEQGQSLVAFDASWRWDAKRNELVADLTLGQRVVLD